MGGASIDHATQRQLGAAGREMHAGTLPTRARREVPRVDEGPGDPGGYRVRAPVAREGARDVRRVGVG